MQALVLTEQRQRVTAQPYPRRQCVTFGAISTAGIPPPPDRKFADSSLEGTGFEPLVPLKAPGVLVVSFVVRVEFSVGAESNGSDMSRPRTWPSQAVPTVRIRLPSASLRTFGPGASRELLRMASSASL